MRIMEKKRMIMAVKLWKKRNKCFAGLLCGAVIAAGLTVSAPPVTAAGAEAGAQQVEAEAGEITGLQQTKLTAEAIYRLAKWGHAGITEDVGTAAEGAPDSSEQENASGAGSAAAGTAILLGAGTYTAVRKQWNEKNEKKSSKTKEYVYFENHTKKRTLLDGEKYVG